MMRRTNPSAFLAAALLGACAAPPRDPRLLAAYGAPDIPPECQAAVYNDPKVHELMVANAGSAALRAQNQDRLAFLQDRALRDCLAAKGQLPAGGVEPVRHTWYPSPF